MKLVDSSGHDISKPKKIVDAEGRPTGIQINGETKPMSVEDLGKQLAAHMLAGADKMPTQELFQKNLNIAYYAALNIIAHRVLNVSLGAGLEGSILSWDENRNVEETTAVIADLGKVCSEWKDLYFNGELKFNQPKKN